MTVLDVGLEKDQTVTAKSSSSTHTEAQSSTKKRASVSLAQRLVDWILERIQQGELKPGDKLPTETALMQAQGVSRTVVREALQRLQASGAVETRHGVGTFILEQATDRTANGLSFNIDPIKDAVLILELRLSLEVEAAGLAAERRPAQILQQMREVLDELNSLDKNGNSKIASQLDFKFHQLIAQATNNYYFTEIMGHLKPSLVPRKRIDVQRVHNEHEEVFAAIARGDSYAARAAMRIHLTNSKERFLQLKKG